MYDVYIIYIVLLISQIHNLVISCKYCSPVYIIIRNNYVCMYMYTCICWFLQFQYSHFASSFRVLWLLKFVPQVRLIMWTVLKSLEVSLYILYTGTCIYVHLHTYFNMKLYVRTCIRTYVYGLYHMHSTYMYMRAWYMYMDYHMHNTYMYVRR